MANNIIQNIFSIKNDTDKKHKIITLFFTKIKIKSYKLMYKNFEKKCTNLKEKNKRYLEAIKTNPEMYEIYIRNPKIKEKDEKHYNIASAKINEILSKPQMPLFYMCEIETINKCNGECDFCPVNRYDDPREFKLMDEHLFYNIINQLKELNYNGRLYLFSNNEPLMDKRIYDFMDYARKELPNVHMGLFSNTLLLDLDKFKRLIPNLNTFVLDVYHDGEEIIPNNLIPVIEYCLKNQDLQRKVKVQFINKKAIRNNRGGNSKNRKHLYAPKSPCLFPFTQVIIRPDGKLSLCCNDATAEFTMGDLTKDKLINIWNNEQYKELRNRMQQGRKLINKCRFCDAFLGYGFNYSPNYLFTEKEFDISWIKIKEIIKNNSELPPPRTLVQSENK